MDIFDFDSSVRSDLEDTVDSINRYMLENSIELTPGAEPGDDLPGDQEPLTEEHSIQ